MAGSAMMGDKRGAAFASVSMMAFTVALVSPHASALAAEASDTVVVTADKLHSHKLDLSTALGAIQDTPQAIQVIPQKLLQEQKVTSLEQALRNVPGITVAIGEGGTLNGDQFKIRGQDAKDDVYIDGLKDFGAYVRDSFDDQEVQVLKGPSATAFGRGTTGAAINVVSKTPQLKEVYSIDGAVGMGDYYRGDLDINHRLNDTTAVRLVAMGNATKEVDRDDAKSERWGVAPSVAFGLGTDTRLNVGYFYQHNNNRPDYGVPLVLEGGTPVPAVTSAGVKVTELSGASARPVTELGVDRSTYYGFKADHDRTDAHMLTARFDRQENSWLTLTNDARAAYYTRDFLATQATCSSPVISGVSTTAHCADYLQAHNPAAVVQISGPSPYRQTTYGFQDIGTAHIDAPLFGFRNRGLVGFDVNYESNTRTANILLPAKVATKSVYAPSDGGSYVETSVNAANSLGTANARRASLGADYAAFFNDQVWLTPQWSIIGALRFDHFAAKYDTTSAAQVKIGQKVDSDLLNPKVALVFEPNKEQTYYISWSKSATPQGSSVADASAAVTSASLEPEKNEIYEAGAKFSLLRDRLGVEGSVFEINKNNALQPDPAGSGFLLANSGQKQRIKGVELELTGKITKNWSMNLGYSYLDTTILSDFTAATVSGVAVQIPNTFSVGKQIYYTPKNAATLWTTYAFDGQRFGGVLKGLTVGGGVTYQDRVYTNYAYITATSGNSYSAPTQLDYSSVVQYEWSRYKLSLNGYNLANRLNYTQVYANRVLPEQGRTFVASFGVTF